VGSIVSGGQEWVLVQDDHGGIHRLRVGDYIGENSGVIRAIDGDFIYVEQLVPASGGAPREPLIVKFPKTKGIPD
jgi:Tfp pilus assembly protein PilP